MKFPANLNESYMRSMPNNAGGKDRELGRVGSGEEPDLRLISPALGSPYEDTPQGIHSVAALRTAFGDRIVDRVIHELGLNEAAGTALSPVQIDQAMAMCAACRSVFSGANFITRILLSPTNNTAEFRAVAQAEGLDADALSEDSRQRIDKLYTNLFEQAAGMNCNCVGPEDARALLRRAIAMEVQGDGVSPAVNPSRRV